MNYDNTRGRTTMALTQLPTAATVVTGAPWPVAFAVGLAGLLVGALGKVFPQNSRDRLHWWRDWRRYLDDARHRDRADTAPAPGDLVP